jgi:lipoprotein NlpI
MRLLAMVLRAALAACALVCVLSAAAMAQGAGDQPRLKEVQVESKAFLVGEPTPAWVETAAIPEGAADKYPVVGRLIDTQYRVDTVPSIYVRRVITINDAASLTQAGQLLIPFVPEYNLVRLHAVRVLRGTEVLDRTASAAIRFFQRETGLEQGVYVGEITASILVSDLRVGDTLELAYTREGQNPVFGGKFIDALAWDYGYPSLYRRVIVNSPADRRIAWKMLGGQPSRALTPAETADAGMRRLLFEERALAQVQPEPMTPPDYYPYRWLQFSEFTGWDDVVVWAEGLFRTGDGDVLDEELREIVRSLRAKATDEERVVAALEFVQAQIRYFSVSLGESSHRPALPAVTMQRRYGDCKDKSLLLIALLRALGIESRPVLVSLGRRRGLDAALPSPHLFDHVIVQVKLGGEIHYLDPTRLGQHGPLQRMGQVHAHAQVLPVAPGIRRLVTVPEPSTRELRSEIVESATLADFAGDAELQLRQTWRGVGAESIRLMHQHMPREQMSKSFEGLMEQRYPGARRVGEPSIEDDRAKNTLTLSMTFTIPKMATERDGNWFIRYLPTNLRGALAPPPSSARTAPLLLGAFPYSASYTFEIKLPDKVSVVTDPTATAIKNKVFSYTQAAHFRGNSAKAVIELRVTAAQVAPEDLKQYADDVRTMDNTRIGLIVVPKAAIKSVAAAKRDFAAVLRERVQDVVAKTTQAVKSGKLGGADLANAYCMRSGAHADLGSVSEALADAGEAVKLAPQSVDVLYCRGYAYFGAGDFDKSVADFSKAILLGAGEKAFHQRGVSRFYAGALEAAAEDFVKASETSDKEAQVFADLWLAWTYQRLGKALPDDLVKRAAAQANGPWPRPALAVLTGSMAPGDLVRLIERKSGDEGKMVASEGYFYLGQHFLARGEAAKARELFQKARQANVFIYTEHKAAEFELRKLPEPAGAAAPEGEAAPRKPAAKRTKPANPAAEAKTKKTGASDTDWRNGAFTR